MKLKLVLFDLDGTLLPMDQDVFVKSYFKLLATKLAPYGYEPKQFIGVIWAGVNAMVKNTGTYSNEVAFWKKFTEAYGEKAIAHKPIIESFYRVEFQQAKASCGYNPQAASVVYELKKMGFRVGLATNPLFPSTATESRIQWAGLLPEDFELYTTYENSRYCKPNPAYYKDILSQLDVRPEECLMVGNDVTEDMIAENLGMKVFLLTDCIINKENKDISVYPKGNFSALLDYIKSQQIEVLL